jgi:hypothetical protein
MRAIAIAAALMVGTLARPDLAHGDELFKATLNGEQEVPPFQSGTTGRVKIRINSTETAGEFTLTVNDGWRVQQAHIHCGEPGVNGPVVVFLAGLHAPGFDVDGEWVSNATFTDANMVNRETECGASLGDLISAMRAGKTYANVHTVTHPGGEIRGLIVAQ